MITLKFNTREWHDTATELRRFKNMDVPKFVRYRARVVVQDLIKFTPPRGKNPGSESFAQQKKRGEKTIMRDVSRVFGAIDQLGVNQRPENPKLAEAFGKALASKDLSALDTLLRNIKVKFKALLSEPSPSIHQQARGMRGTVVSRQGYFVPLKSQVTAFAKTLFSHVGKAKSGWGAAAFLLGVPDKNWPQWVKRHGANGSIEDRTGNVSRPTIRVENDRKEVAGMSSEEIVGAVMAINENKLRKELEAIWAYEKRKIGSMHHH